MADKTTLAERIAELRAQAKSESGVGAKYGSPPMSEYLGLLAIAEAADDVQAAFTPVGGGLTLMVSGVEAERRLKALTALCDAFAKGVPEPAAPKKRRARKGAK